MIVRKYTAATETDAVLKAKEELGLGAVVLNVKTVKQRGFARLFKKDYVEITAALDERDIQQQQQPAAPPPPDRRPSPSTINGTANMMPGTLGASVTSMASAAQAASPVSPASPAPGSEAMEKRLDTLLNMLADQVKKNEDDKVKTESTPVEVVKEPEPEEAKDNGNIKYLRMVYNKLIESEVDEKVANMIIEDVDASMKKGVNIDNIISAVYQKIILKLGEPKPVNISNGRTVVFFLGPTGVGKTTTIAKLASKYKLNKGVQVALITADTYRIAAVEQLNTYAGIIDVPISVIYSPEELVAAINKYSRYNLIFVDTAGRSHKNTERLAELGQLIEATQKAGLGVNIEKYLVLSATTKYKDLLDITEAYKDVENFKLIFTKLDETNAYGNILNIRVHTGAQLSYTTNGQAVPEDIKVVNVQEMARYLISGYVPDNLK